jgi:serine/threonine-protein kinase
MDELIGQTLGQYHIKEKIGEGGMATVFKAHQLNLDRHIALKVLPPYFASKYPAFAKRFQREAKAVARLHHPNILPVYEYGTIENYSYIAMRYVEGSQTLGHLMPRALTNERILDLVSQVAAALTHAHKHGIVHRDVKPANILMADGSWALLSDFGLVQDDESGSRLTDTGKGIGTAAYMSPEQAQGSRVDHRTDIYALGVILYEMLTGIIPHDASTPLGIMLKRTTQPPPLPRALNPTIPLGVEQIIVRALAVKPKDRYDSAVEFANALKKAMAEDDQPDPGGKSLLRKTAELSHIRPPARYRTQYTSTKGKWASALSHPSWLVIVASGIALLPLLFWGNSALSWATSRTNPTPTAPLIAAVSTATRTPTLTPTPTETSLPTDTPAPPTVTPALPTSTPTFTPSPPTPTNTPALPDVAATPTQSVPTGTWTLLNPVSLEEPSYGQTQFEWQWSGDLPPDTGFEVRVWREGESPAGVHNASQDNQAGRIETISENRYRLIVDITEAAGVQDRTGEYWWTVGLIQISPEYKYIGEESSPARFRFEAGGSGGGGNDGGGNSGGGGSIS